MAHVTITTSSTATSRISARVMPVLSVSERSPDDDPEDAADAAAGETLDVAAAPSASVSASSTIPPPPVGAVDTTTPDPARSRSERSARRAVRVGVADAAEAAHAQRSRTAAAHNARSVTERTMARFEVRATVRRRRRRGCLLAGAEIPRILRTPLRWPNPAPRGRRRGKSDDPKKKRFRGNIT